MNCPFLSIPREKKGKIEYKHFQCMEDKCTFWGDGKCILAEKTPFEAEARISGIEKSIAELKDIFLSGSSQNSVKTLSEAFPESRLEALESRIAAGRTTIEEVSLKTVDFLVKIEKIIDEDRKDREESLASLKTISQDSADYVIKKLDKINEAASARLEDFTAKVPESVRSAIGSKLDDALKNIAANGPGSSETAVIMPSSTESIEKLVKEGMNSIASAMEGKFSSLREIYSKSFEQFKESFSEMVAGAGSSSSVLDAEKLIADIKSTLQEFEERVKSQGEEKLGNRFEEIKSSIGSAVSSLEKQFSGIESSISLSGSKTYENIDKVKSLISEVREDFIKLHKVSESHADSLNLLSGNQKQWADNLESLLSKGNELTGNSLAEQTKVIKSLEKEFEEYKSTGSSELRSAFSALDKKFISGITAALNHVKGSHESLKKLIDGYSEKYASGLENNKKDMISAFTSALDKLSALDSVLSEFREEQKETAVKIINGYRVVSDYFEKHKLFVEKELETKKKKSAKEHNDRGAVLFHRKAFEAAEKEFHEAISHDPELAEAFNNLGLACSELGKQNEAIEAFKKAIELSPDMSEAFSNLGLLYHNSGDYLKAVEYFRESIGKDVNFSVAYSNLGNSFYALGKFSEAVKSWRKSLELDPANEQARNYLAAFRKYPENNGL